MRASLVECVASIAEHELPEGRWQDLLPFLNQCTQAPVAEHRASSVTLFKALAESVPAFLAPHFPALQAVCVKGLRDESDLVRRASLFAVSGILGALRLALPSHDTLRQFCTVMSFLLRPRQGSRGSLHPWTRPAGLAGADKTHTALLQQLMAPTIDVLEACISASISTGALDDAHNGISLLLEIIEEPLPLLVDCFPRIVRLSLTTTCSREVELELRNHASQVCPPPSGAPSATPHAHLQPAVTLATVLPPRPSTLLVPLATRGSCSCPAWRCAQVSAPGAASARMRLPGPNQGGAHTGAVCSSNAMLVQGVHADSAA